MKEFLNWAKARLAERSTQRSIPMYFFSVAAAIYAIIHNEPSSALVSAGTALYSVMNAVTSEKK
jgi:hypothetical protein